MRTPPRWTMRLPTFSSSCITGITCDSVSARCSEPVSDRPWREPWRSTFWPCRLLPWFCRSALWREADSPALGADAWAPVQPPACHCDLYSSISMGPKPSTMSAARSTSSCVAVCTVSTTLPRLTASPYTTRSSSSSPNRVVKKCLMLSPIESSWVDAVVPAVVVLDVPVVAAPALSWTESAPMPDLTSSSRARSATARLSNTAARVRLMILLLLLRWVVQIARSVFVERFDAHVFGLERNGLAVFMLLAYPGDVQLFPDAVALFDHQDFFQDGDDQYIAFVARWRRFGHHAVHRHAAHVDFFLPQRFPDFLGMLGDGFADAHTPARIDDAGGDFHLLAADRDGNGAGVGAGIDVCMTAGDCVGFLALVHATRLYGLLARGGATLPDCY